jgi:hypothetical protein
MIWVLLLPNILKNILELKMDNDFKWFMIVMIAVIGMPSVVMGVGEWHKQDCRIELSKAGKTVEEVRELCK